MKNRKFILQGALEQRILQSALPSVASQVEAADVTTDATANHKANSFVAKLDLVVQTAPDPATGVLKIAFSPNGNEARVTGYISNISNVSAIVLRLPTIVTPGATDSTPPTMTYQTVAALIKPGSGSGAVLRHPFDLPIGRFALIGPLAGSPLTALRRYTREGIVSAVVLTNNGVDPATSMAPGNMQNGEIQGLLLPHNAKAV